MHPFQWASNYHIDHGRSIKNHGNNLKRFWKPNKYSLPYAAIEITNSKTSYSDFGDISGFYPSNGETFTILFDMMLYGSSNVMGLFNIGGRLAMLFDDNHIIIW